MREREKVATDVADVEKDAVDNSGRRQGLAEVKKRRGGREKERGERQMRGKKRK